MSTGKFKFLEKIFDSLHPWYNGHRIHQLFWGILL